MVVVLLLLQVWYNNVSLLCIYRDTQTVNEDSQKHCRSVGVGVSLMEALVKHA